MLCLLALSAVLLHGVSTLAQGQGRARKLPAPDKIVSDYLKAVGGKKAQAAIRDAVREWAVSDGETGTAEARARTYTRAPGATRADMISADGETNSAANERTAWERRPGGKLRTLTDKEAGAAKLQAALEAGRLVDYKKQDVLARTVGVEQIGGEPAYLVEFSRRNGARVRYWFSVPTKYLVGVRDDLRGLTLRFSDYRPANEGGSKTLEPHRIEIVADQEPPLTLALQSVRYNTNLSAALFEPPGDATLDIAALLREVGRNQRGVDERISEYTYTRKDTEREINDHGEIKKEKTTLYEIYAVPGGGRVLKLVSENGVPLSPERAAKEEKRVAEELEKIERENQKRKQKREELKRRNETGAGEDGDEDVGITTFLRACEFVSPRRELFRGRETIVFDFRPRPGFKPASRGESVVAKLAGVAWIDPIEKQVMRLEARLEQGFKIGGGLVASVKPGSAVVFEQTRLPDGVWLPRFSQINAAAKVFLFAGFRLDATREYSDYKRFSTKTDDAKLDAPATKQ
ncbi:MAG: hypothetical protein LC742_01175 [Acidobacteria bacterium]|nr:hypothetical protein [Acidobacteriota bacterium]